MKLGNAYLINSRIQIRHHLRAGGNLAGLRQRMRLNGLPHPAMDRRLYGDDGRFATLHLPKRPYCLSGLPETQKTVQAACFTDTDSASENLAEHL